MRNHPSTQLPSPPSSDKPLIAACGTSLSHLSAFCLIPQHLCPTSIGFTFDPSQHLTSHLSACPLLLLHSSSLCLLFPSSPHSPHLHLRGFFFSLCAWFRPHPPAYSVSPAPSSAPLTSLTVRLSGRRLRCTALRRDTPLTTSINQPRLDFFFKAASHAELGQNGSASVSRRRYDETPKSNPNILQCRAAPNPCQCWSRSRASTLHLISPFLIAASSSPKRSLPLRSGVRASETRPLRLQRTMHGSTRLSCPARMLNSSLTSTSR